MKTAELHEIWKKYIDVPIYRVVASQDYQSILTKGLDPKKDPHEKIKPKMRKLRDLVVKLEKKGFVMKFPWGKAEAVGSYGVKTSCMELALPYIDFSPNLGTYYMKMEGGATATGTRTLTEKLIKEKPKLTKKNWKLVKDLNNWAMKRRCPMKPIYVRGSSKIFESARFQLLNSQKEKLRIKRKPREYLPNPFGGFEHFKKVIKKNGLKKFLPYLESRNFYLRVREKIPVSEIRSI